METLNKVTASYSRYSNKAHTLTSEILEANVKTGASVDEDNKKHLLVHCRQLQAYFFRLQVGLCPVYVFRGDTQTHKTLRFI